MFASLQVDNRTLHVLLLLLLLLLSCNGGFLTCHLRIPWLP